MKYILTALLICLIVPNVIFAAPIFPYGGVAVMHASGCTETDYVAVADTNVARGTALLNAVSNAINGDVLYLSAGTFDIGDNGAVDMTVVGGHFNMHGAGKLLTTIYGGLPGGQTGAIISIASNSQLTDLGVVDYLRDYSFPVGINNGQDNISITGAIIQDVVISGASDALYFYANHVDVDIIRVTTYSNYDSIAVNLSTGNVRVYDSDLHGAYDAGLNYPVYGIDDVGGVVSVWNTQITTTGSQDAGAKVRSATTNLYGGSINSSASGFDLHNSLGGEINIDSYVQYNPSKTFGDINQVSTVLEVIPILPLETCLYPPLSNDATLSSLAVSQGTLSPPFLSGTASYTTGVANSVASITVTPTVNQANATITVNGTLVTSGEASGAIALEVGSNTITTAVTAEDGLTTETYIITTTRAVGGGGGATYHRITSFAGLNGSIFPLDSASVIHGRSQSFIITPNVNYQVADVLVDGVSMGKITSYTFNNVIDDNTISATFSSVSVEPTTVWVVQNNSATIAAIKNQLIVLITQVLQLLQAQLATIMAGR